MFKLSTAIIYSTAYRLPIWIAYKISYKHPLYFGIPGVPRQDPRKPTKMYRPELTRFARIFLASRRPTLPGFHHIDGCGVQISPDFDIYIRKMPEKCLKIIFSPWSARDSI